MRLVLFIVCLTLTTLQVVGQGDSTHRESTFIKYLDDFLVISLSGHSDAERFRVDTETNDLELYPNAELPIRISINYRFLSASVKFAPAFIPGNDDDEIKGKTRVSGFAGSLFLNHWFHQFQYSRIQGYYLNNTSDYDSEWTRGDPYIQFPNLVTKNFQGFSGYKVNNRYSLRALHSQTERQEKSAGSFIGGMLYRYYITDDRSNTPGSSTQKSNNLEISLTPSYQHTLVFRKYMYLSGAVSAGLGYHQTWLTTRTPGGNFETQQRNPLLRWEAQIGGGFNGERFYTGFLIQGTSSQYQQGNTTVLNGDDRIIYHLFFGYRIIAPRALKKATQAIPLGNK